MKISHSKSLLIAVPLLILVVWVTATSNNMLDRLNNSQVLTNDLLKRLNQQEISVTPKIIFGEDSILGVINADECDEVDFPLAERSVHKVVERNFKTLNSTLPWKLSCLQPRQVYDKAMLQALERYKTLYQVANESLPHTETGLSCCSTYQKINAQKILDLWQSLICTNRNTIESADEAFHAEMYWRVKDDSLVSDTLDPRCAPK